MTRTWTNLVLKSLLGVITVMTLFTHQAISGPIAGPKGILVAPVDNSQFVQVRAARAYRGGSVHRGAAVHRRATVYRGGAVVRRGAVVGGTRYYGGSCDPYYGNCGGGSYYRGGAVAAPSSGAEPSSDVALLSAADIEEPMLGTIGAADAGADPGLSMGHRL